MRKRTYRHRLAEGFPTTTHTGLDKDEFSYRCRHDNSSSLSSDQTCCDSVGKRTVRLGVHMLLLSRTTCVCHTSRRCEGTPGIQRIIGAVVTATTNT